MARRHVLGVALVAIITGGCAASSAMTGPPPVMTPVTALTPIETTTTTAPEPEVTTTTVANELGPIKTPRQRLVVSGTGDVNLDPAFVRSFRTTGYEDAWTGLHGAFLRDDLTIVNLECSPSNLGTPWDKPWTFRCDPAALPSMADAGVDVANLANNHSMDFGFEAMLDGRENLRAVGIAPVGAGANSEEAYEPFITEVNGWTVAVIGSGGVGPETGSWVAGANRPGMTRGDDTESISEAIRRAKESADLVFVTAHWGVQYASKIGEFERRQAVAWIDAGADGIFGHHQHVLHPLEFYNGRPIAWGLGNLVWQAHPPGSTTTAIAQFVYEPDGRVGACLVPVVIERTGHPVVQEPWAPVCAPGSAR